MLERRHGEASEHGHTTTPLEMDSPTEPGPTPLSAPLPRPSDARPRSLSRPSTFHFKPRVRPVLPGNEAKEEKKLPDENVWTEARSARAKLLWKKVRGPLLRRIGAKVMTASMSYKLHLPYIVYCNCTVTDIQVHPRAAACDIDFQLLLLYKDDELVRQLEKDEYGKGSTRRKEYHPTFFEPDFAHGDFEGGYGSARSSFYVHRDKETGEAWVQNRRRYSGTLKVAMRYRDFPFDVQASWSDVLRLERCSAVGAASADRAGSPHLAAQGRRHTPH